MILHGYWRSSATYRVRLALALKGLTYEYRPVNIAPGQDAQHAPAFRALNPEGRVPALEADGHLLTQSWAILEWLEERHPAVHLHGPEPGSQRVGVEGVEPDGDALPRDG